MYKDSTSQPKRTFVVLRIVDYLGSNIDWSGQEKRTQGDTKITLITWTIDIRTMTIL